MRKPQPRVPIIKGEYKGFKLRDVATRPGSIDMLDLPSRIGNTLYYPNGDTVKMYDEPRRTGSASS